jgi:hypothetical protein
VAVYRTEPRSSKGEEDGRMFGDRLLDSLTAFEAGTNEMAGVAPVQGGTRRTSQLRSRPTSLEHDIVREAVTREDDPTTFAEHVSAQPDGVRAPTAARSLDQEVVQALRIRMATERTHHCDVVFVQHGRHHDERLRHLSTIVPAQIT